MFGSKMIAERGLVLVSALTVLAIHKFSLMVLVSHMSVDCSSMNPFVTVLTLNFAYIYKYKHSQSATSLLLLIIFLRLQNSMSSTLVLLETPFSFKSSVTDKTDTGLCLCVLHSNVTVDIFPSYRHPAVETLDHVRTACNNVHAKNLHQSHELVTR